MSKESFARSQAHPRKVELAKILLGESETKFEDAIASGFNETIVQEMATSISRNVEGMQTFAADLKNGRKTEEVVEESKTDQEKTIENDLQNEVPNESTDPVDPNPSAEDSAPVQTEGVEESTPNPTTPGTPNSQA